MKSSIFAVLLAAAALAAPPAVAQQPSVPRHIVSIYRAAPGQQEALLRWFAQQDEDARAAGVAPAQLYIHQDGASWDFISIQPVTTEAQDAAIEAAARRAHHTAGPRAGLELRRYIAEHSDTFAAGPVTAAEWLRRIGE
jgi:hypothetical protein